MIIENFKCPKCQTRFMEKDSKGRVKRLPNHHQFPIVLNNGDITLLAVCKDCFKKLKKKDYIDIFEAVKDYWKKESKEEKIIKRVDSLSFKELSKDPKYIERNYDRNLPNM